LCGMAPLMPRRNIALRALALRRLPGAGPAGRRRCSFLAYSNP
jgi:hypothetical protein